MLKQSLQLKLGQQLTMTPQLQQAIRLLQLPTLELQAHIRELLETNVMLEQDEDSESVAYDSLPSTETTPQTAAAPPEETPGRNRRGQLGGSQCRPVREPLEQLDDEERQQEYADGRGETLQQHLQWQLEMRTARPRSGDRSRDHRCHQRRWLPDRALRCHRQPRCKPEIQASDAEIGEMLEMVQGFDPVGVAHARSANACCCSCACWLPIRRGCAAHAPLPRAHLDLVAQREFSTLRRELRFTRTSSNRVCCWCVAVIRARRADQLRAARIRGARCIRAPYRRRLDRRDEFRHAAEGARERRLCQPHRTQCRPRHHAHAAAGGALAAEEPGDTPRHAAQGRPLHRRAAAASSWSRARSTCGR